MGEIIQPPKKDKISLKEFRAWMDGLLSGNDHPRDLPSLDQWRKILNMMERIEEPANAHQVQYWYYPNAYYVPAQTPNHTHTMPYWQPNATWGFGYTSGTATITPSGVQATTLPMTSGTGTNLNTWNTGTLAGFNTK